MKIHVCFKQQLVKKKAINLKESREKHRERFRGREQKGEL